MVGGLGNDRFIGGYLEDTVETWSRPGTRDVFIGGHGPDQLLNSWSTPRNVRDDRGELVFHGGPGDDSANEMDRQGLVTFYGGDGNDTIKGEGIVPNLIAYGGAGDDFLAGSSRSQVLRIYGGTGNDTLYSVFSGGLLVGGEGDDRLWGLGKKIAGAGDDQIESFGGVALGGEGNDRLTGSGRLVGDAGNDLIFSADEASVVNGGEGTDACGVIDLQRNCEDEQTTNPVGPFDIDFYD